MNSFKQMQAPDDTTNVVPDLPMDEVRNLIQHVGGWLDATAEQFLSTNGLWQAAALAIGIGLGYLLSRYPRSVLLTRLNDLDKPFLLRRLYRSGRAILWPLFSVILLWIAVAFFDGQDMPHDGLRICASLLNAWIVVRLVGSNVKQSFWSRTLMVSAWVVAALNILHLLGPVTGWMQHATFAVGGLDLNLYKLTMSVVVGLLAFWVAGLVGDVTQARLKASKSLNPSIAGLLGQVLKIALLIIAAIVAIETLGVNLTALAVFSGALGVGVGFGLQAVFSNFISGVIILFEKSLKVGDFIELQSGVTGLVKEINIRSTLLTTNDNVDILVPNEEFIKGQVTNWTLRDTLRRLHIPFGVAYSSDKDVVKEAALEAAAEVTWTFTQQADRAPQVWLVGFGDSSLDFELVVWLTDDGVKRPARVKADYNWALHSALERHGIEIPFPQQDIHFRDARLVDAALNALDKAGSDNQPNTEGGSAAPTRRKSSSPKD